jgi:hypothetical protein
MTGLLSARGRRVVTGAGDDVYVAGQVFGSLMRHLGGGAEVSQVEVALLARRMVHSAGFGLLVAASGSQHRLAARVLGAVMRAIPKRGPTTAQALGTHRAPTGAGRPDSAPSSTSAGTGSPAAGAYAWRARASEIPRGDIACHR